MRRSATMLDLLRRNRKFACTGWSAKKFLHCLRLPSLFLCNIGLPRFFSRNELLVFLI
jgi:hypothetical protein